MSKDLTDALRALSESAPPAPQPKPQPRGAMPAAKSAALPAGPSKGGNIASPLTETAVADREYYATYYKSTDGLFTMPAIKKLKFKDANGSEVVLNFKAPA